MVPTAALLLTLLADPAPLGPLPGESARAFQCRSAHLPEARRCTARCEEAYPRPADSTPRFDCVSACTVKTLGRMAECRKAETPPPPVEPEPRLNR